jgi:hypothetical protein
MPPGAQRTTRANARDHRTRGCSYTGADDGSRTLEARSRRVDLRSQSASVSASDGGLSGKGDRVSALPPSRS